MSSFICFSDHVCVLQSTYLMYIFLLRIWKRCASKKKELREQKRLVANAALTSLSLGLHIRHPEIVSISVLPTIFNFYIFRLST